MAQWRADPGEGWTVSYQLHYEVYDLLAGTTPLAAGDIGNAFNGSGLFTFFDNFGDTPLVGDLEFGREYTVYAWLDTEAAAFAVPAPGAALVMAIGAMLASRRRRAGASV